MADDRLFLRCKQCGCMKALAGFLGGHCDLYNGQTYGDGSGEDSIAEWLTQHCIVERDFNLSFSTLAPVEIITEQQQTDILKMADSYVVRVSCDGDRNAEM